MLHIMKWPIGHKEDYLEFFCFLFRIFIYIVSRNAKTPIIAQKIQDRTRKHEQNRIHQVRGKKKSIWIQ